MPRKRWQPREGNSPDIINSREKRKWQIAFRRYVLEKRGSSFYAPFFGLDIENIRKWMEIQFSEGVGWLDFGKKWQFDHILPVSCFDFENPDDLKLCWNFLNLRVVILGAHKKKVDSLDILAARNFFKTVFTQTQYSVCERFLEKIDQLEAFKWIPSGQQQSFLLEKKNFLEEIEGFDAYAFDLL
ncbi:MAG TPA: hypothetical protein VLJ68_09485, partial [Chitinophagaceae bacterium]|nr:hypothetical protein [Chitinophagaceae bacterium]